MTRRFVLLGAATAAALLVWFLTRSAPPTHAPVTPPASPAPAGAAPTPTKTSPAVPTATPPAFDSIEVAEAATLNAPGGTIGADLETLNTVFTNWRLDFPHIGNPWGENVEITAALTGANPLGQPLISHQNRAINAVGELCDRWGTPFLFHALSGDRMEIRSAGPDRKFGTADDATLTPP